MRLVFRTAIGSDEPFLREMLWLALFVPPGASPLPRAVLSEPAISRYVDGWSKWPGDYGMIALMDNVPVGAGWLRRFSAGAPGYGFVDDHTPELSIALLPEFRGQGIGSRMLGELLRHTPSVSLSCDLANPACRLYARYGFRPLPDGRTMLRSC